MSEKTFVIAKETVDNIVKGQAYELIDIDDSELFFFIIDETTEEASYAHNCFTNERLYCCFI